MKNFYSKLMLGFLLLSTSTINAQTTTYCPPTWGGWSANLPPEPITLVQFGTGVGSINNPSTDAILSTTPRYDGQRVHTPKTHSDIVAPHPTSECQYYLYYLI